MRPTILVIAAVAVAGIQPTLAQRKSPTSAPANSSQRLAMAAPRAEATRPARMACVPLVGKVYDPNGKPLVGATLLIKGSKQVFLTDTSGHFNLATTVYEGQVLTVQAAGFKIREVPLVDCTLPRLVLERNPEAHLKRNGKRAGQVTRIGHSKL